MMANRTITFDSAAIAEFCKTHTWEEAAAKFRCSRATISNACKSNGVSVYSRAAEKRRKIACWVHDNEATTSEASKKFRVPHAKVVAACGAFGVVPSEDTEVVMPVSLSNFEVLRFLLQGYTHNQIAKEMFISKQRVGQVAAKAEQAGLFGPDAIIEIKAKHRTNGRDAK